MIKRIIWIIWSRGKETLLWFSQPPNEPKNKFKLSGTLSLFQSFKICHWGLTNNWNTSLHLLNFKDKRTSTQSCMADIIQYQNWVVHPFAAPTLWERQLCLWFLSVLFPLISKDENSNYIFSSTFPRKNDGQKVSGDSVTQHHKRFCTRGFQF